MLVAPYVGYLECIFWHQIFFFFLHKKNPVIANLLNTFQIIFVNILCLSDVYFFLFPITFLSSFFFKTVKWMTLQKFNALVWLVCGLHNADIRRKKVGGKKFKRLYYSRKLNQSLSITESAVLWFEELAQSQKIKNIS